MPLAYKFAGRDATGGPLWIGYLTGKFGSDKAEWLRKMRAQTQKLREREHHGQLVLEIKEDALLPQEVEPR